MSASIYHPGLKPDRSGRYTQRRYWAVKYTIRGTTYSGHPTRTTLGNTLRVLLYFHFYTDTAVVTRFNKTDTIFVLVSGDDCVLWT